MKIFRFKLFDIIHEHSAMKVGTDGVLLGALTRVPGEGRILDVGCGCGLLALMLAQRSTSQITGIDIDQAGIGDAHKNAESCLWKERLCFLHISLRDFIKTDPLPFDLLISNPPFFSRSLLSPDNRRNLARHDRQMTHEDLISGAAILLRDGGELSVILPAEAVLHFRHTCRQNGLDLKDQWIIAPREGKAPHRSILTFVKGTASDLHSHELCIRDHEGRYTAQYRKLTAAYHLNL